MKTLTLEFIPYGEIENLSSEDRIDKLFKLAKEENIVLLQGKLKPNEEIMLIQKTMENISRKFRGIEICSIDEDKKESAMALNKMKKSFVNLILGNRKGFTIIGPASVIREIKRDPKKIQLLTNIKRNK
ncbi:DUF2073 domain-containing protein [Candidatus Woesearchaeota archaeon]|nr:DUF2073 domain-containing protein [Candidatus Woesearchaeota archaeon]